jgi:predicted DNA-binding transcriptional regulator AlpA
MTLDMFLKGLENEASRHEAMGATAKIADVLRTIAVDLRQVTLEGARPPRTEDRLLDVPTVAKRMGVEPRYVYDHHHEWAFTRRVGKKLRFSEHGLDEWIKRGS